MGEREQIECAGLRITPVDPDSPIPLYYQIESDLRRLITSGDLPPGATLPPELELCQCYGVGRHTMRKALARLNADRLIIRQAGRGTFVRQPPDRKEFLLNRSFTRQMAEMGKRAHSKVLEFSEEVIDQDSSWLPHKYVGARCLRLARLRFGDDEPVGLQYTIVIAELCPGLGLHDFSEDSLYDVLSRDYGLAITEINHAFNAVVADAYQADLLQVAEGEPLLMVKTTAFSGDRRLVEHTASYYRTDKYDYRITQSYPVNL